MKTCNKPSCGSLAPFQNEFCQKHSIEAGARAKKDSMETDDHGNLKRKAK